MNLTLFFIIVFLVIFSTPIWLFKPYQKLEKRFGENRVAGIFIGSIGILLILSIMSTIRYSHSIRYEKTIQKENIISIGNDKYIEGQSSLFSGTVNEVGYYFYYVNTDRGHTREKIEVDKTFIIETDSISPRIDGVYYYYDDKNRFWKVMDDLQPTYFQIYVPKEAIIKKFELR